MKDGLSDLNTMFGTSLSHIGNPLKKLRIKQDLAKIHACNRVSPIDSTVANI